MSMITLEGDRALAMRLRSMSDEMRGQAAEDAVYEGAAVIQSHAVMNAQNVFSAKQRGQLAHSIIPSVRRTGTGAEAEIGPRVIYGRIQELGGTIRPIRAKVLHFKIGNEDVFTKMATLPPRPYLRPAVEENEAEIRKAMMASLNDAFNEMAEREDR